MIVLKSMKTVAFLLCLFPALVFGQYDFETRYFTIDAATLPEVPEITSFQLNWNLSASSEIKSFSDFNRVTANNYWEAVDMAAALEEKDSFKKAEVSVKALNQKFSALGGNAQYQSDGSTKVRNQVYKEQRGLDLIDPCPPFGICPRCAPYRIGRGF